MLMRALLVVCLCQVLESVSGNYAWWQPIKHLPEYVYYFPENPNGTTLLSEVNVDTTIVMFDNWLDATYSDTSEMDQRGEYRFLCSIVIKFYCTLILDNHILLSYNQITRHTPNMSDNKTRNLYDYTV